jgi:hypothetical protein
MLQLHKRAYLTSLLARSFSAQIKYTPGSFDSQIVKNEPNLPIIYDVEQKVGKAPMVCLLGWLGANWKHLSKFSSWYSACNVPTLATIARTPTVVMPSIAHTHVKQYLKQIDALHEQDRRLMFHTLSGNGLLFLGRIVLDPEFEKIKDRVCGVIIDSAPPEIRADRFARGFVGAAKTLLGYKMTPEGSKDFYKHSLLSPLYEFAFRQYLEVWGKKKEFETLRDSVIAKLPNVPQLFIYSDADDLVPAEDIQLFIQMTKKFSKDVQELRFTDSRHVMHFKVHPREYSEKVLSFTEHCMKP